MREKDFICRKCEQPKTEMRADDHPTICTECKKAEETEKKQKYIEKVNSMSDEQVREELGNILYQLYERIIPELNSLETRNAVLK